MAKPKEKQKEAEPLPLSGVHFNRADGLDYADPAELREDPSLLLQGLDWEVSDAFEFATRIPNIKKLAELLGPEDMQARIADYIDWPDKFITYHNPRTPNPPRRKPKDEYERQIYDFMVRLEESNQILLRLIWIGRGAKIESAQLAEVIWNNIANFIDRISDLVDNKKTNTTTDRTDAEIEKAGMAEAQEQFELVADTDVLIDHINSIMEADNISYAKLTRLLGKTNPSHTREILIKTRSASMDTLVEFLLALKREVSITITSPSNPEPK